MRKLEKLAVNAQKINSRKIGPDFQTKKSRF